MILLADDSIHALRMGEQILRGEGFEVVTAPDGESALRLLREKTPRILIADAFLRGSSGAELCRSAPPSTRVILTAGALEEFDEQQARTAGAAAFLRKPFEASVLVNEVRRLATGAVGDSALKAMIAQAVEAEMPRLVRDVTEKVLSELRKNAR